VSERATSTDGSGDPLPSWSALVSVYQAVLHDVVATLEQRTGTDSGVFSALAYIERARPAHRLAMSELQRLMYPRYSQPGFSRLVQRMEADGLVDRRRDPADRRATIVVSTRSGRNQFRRANTAYIAALRTSFGRHLGERDHAQLAAILSRVMAGRNGPRAAAGLKTAPGRSDLAE
jgi:DNA-binding MarR family transcriptional regulator